MDSSDIITILVSFAGSALIPIVYFILTARSQKRKASAEADKAEAEVGKTNAEAGTQRMVARKEEASAAAVLVEGWEKFGNKLEARLAKLEDMVEKREARIEELENEMSQMSLDFMEQIAAIKEANRHEIESVKEAHRREIESWERRYSALNQRMEELETENRILKSPHALPKGKL